MKTKFILFVAAGILTLTACSRKTEPTGMRPAPAHSSESAPVNSVEGLKFTAPESWISEKPSSSMRQAQYRIPHAPGDAADGEMAVFFFQGGGGGVQDNVNRWIGQFTNPDGTPVTNAKTSHKTVNGIPVAIVDVTGTYNAGSMNPMQSDRKPDPNYRLLGAVAEAGDGPWFFKMTGPAKTIAQAEPGFNSLINSIAPK